MYTIAVIGGGVIGLSTALAVQKEFGAKAKVIIFSDKLSPHTTGDVAAGLWTPYILQNTPQNKVMKWSKATQDYILELWKAGAAKDAGISLQLMVNLSDKKNFKVPEWVGIALGHSEIPQEQVEIYNKKYGKKFTGGFTFVSFVWEASRFLPFFQRQFEKQGGEIRRQTIKSFNEVSHYDVVVNCTGLNARLLVPDSSVRPIRGQIARVQAPWQFHCFMTDEEFGHYIIPNQDCVIIGGTHQEDDFNTTINCDDTNFIFDGCSKYVPSLQNAMVIKHQAGLRPGRDTVRLEIETRNLGEKKLKIVHNYGHGGSGITLSVGCAAEAAQLVKEALGYGGYSKL